MIPIDNCDTTLLCHPIIPILDIMFQPVFSPSHGMWTHFIPSLLYQPRIIFHPLMSTMGPPPSHPHVLCPTCGCLFITKASLVCHQLTCSAHKQSSTIRVVMFSALPNSPPLYLDMGHIHWYHQCFPSRFTTPPFIPSYSICFSHWCSTYLVYSFNPYEH
jgi:hypothetical protein